MAHSCILQLFRPAAEFFSRRCLESVDVVQQQAATNCTSVSRRRSWRGFNVSARRTSFSHSAIILPTNGILFLLFLNPTASLFPLGSEECDFPSDLPRGSLFGRNRAHLVPSRDSKATKNTRFPLSNFHDDDFFSHSTSPLFSNAFRLEQSLK